MTSKSYEILNEPAKKQIEELAILNPIVALDYRTTLLHLAVARDNINAVVIITKNKQNLYVKNFLNCDILSTAVISQHINIVKYLLPFYDTLTKDSHGRNALHFSAYISSDNSRAILDLLLQKFSHMINDRDLLGLTPLAFAAAVGYLEHVTLLCQYNATLDTRTNAEDTALLLAIGHGYNGVAGFLIKCGADIKVENHYGFSLRVARSWATRKINVHKELPFQELYKGFYVSRRFIPSLYWGAVFNGDVEHTLDKNAIEDNVKPILNDYQYFTQLDLMDVENTISEYFPIIGSNTISEIIDDQEKQETIIDCRRKALRVLLEKSPENYLQKERNILQESLRKPKPANVIRTPTNTEVRHADIERKEKKETNATTTSFKTYRIQGGVLDIASFVPECANESAVEITRTDPLSKALELISTIKASLLLKSEFKTELGEFGKVIPERLFLTANQHYVVALLENLFEANTNHNDILLEPEHLAILKKIRLSLVKANHIVYDAKNADIYIKYFYPILHAIIAIQEKMQTLASDLSNTDSIRMFNLQLRKILTNVDLINMTGAIQKNCDILNMDGAKNIREILNWIIFGRDLYFGLGSENRFSALSVLQYSEDIRKLWHSSLSKAIVDLELACQNPKHFKLFLGFTEKDIEKIHFYRNKLAHGEELSPKSLRLCLDIFDKLTQNDIFNLEKNETVIASISTMQDSGITASAAATASSTVASSSVPEVQEAKAQKVKFPEFSGGIQSIVGDPLVWQATRPERRRQQSNPETVLISNLGAGVTAPPKTGLG